MPFICAYDNLAGRLFRVFPLRGNCDVFCRHSCGDRFIPAYKVVTLSRRGGRGGNLRAVILRDGCDFSAACGVEGDGVFIDFPLCRDRHILGRHGRGNFRIPADKGVPLSCRGGRCGNRRAVTLRNRSDFSAACGVKGHCVGVRYPFCIQCYVIGDFIACIIPRRAVGLVPATEGIARCGGGVVGTRRESAGGQNLLCVFTVAVLVGHDDAGRIAVNIQTAVEEAPVNMAWIYTGSSADHRLAFEGGNTVIFCKTGDLT